MSELIEFARRRSGDRFAEHLIGMNAEFLVEEGLPFRLISRIVTPSVSMERVVAHLLRTAGRDEADVRLRAPWFYGARRE
ncbi:DarT ssDNA thymidine ADP-ribosyltransferase family protein [Agromyces sp. GXQ0307]|uniref:DarT ssDNA thymidine ADP-ribosyltransferase family protein n=1 Tax=Agromyces sp. GXQ0307 TaxID=3377835 RepID=UPI00383B3156